MKNNKLLIKKGEKKFSSSTNLFYFTIRDNKREDIFLKKSFISLISEIKILKFQIKEKFSYSI